MSMLINPYRYATGGGGLLDMTTAVMADSPWAWWKLTETTGATLDHSGNARDLSASPAPDGTYRGRPPLIDDGNTAYDFNGATSGAASGTVTALGGNIGIGYFAIVKPTSLLGSESWIMHAGNTGSGGNQGILFGLSPAGRLVIWTNASGWYQYTDNTSGIVVSAGETSLIGFWHDPTADTITLWKNGNQIHSIAHSAGMGTPSTAFTVGGANSTGVFVGRMQHAMVFNSLSDTPANRFLAHAEAAGLA